MCVKAVECVSVAGTMLSFTNSQQQQQRPHERYFWREVRGSGGRYIQHAFYLIRVYITYEKLLVVRKGQVLVLLGWKSMKYTFVTNIVYAKIFDTQKLFFKLNVIEELVTLWNFQNSDMLDQKLTGNLIVSPNPYHNCGLNETLYWDIIYYLIEIL